MDTKKLNQIVRDFYPVSEDLQRLINSANYDLYFGPYQVGEDLDGDGVLYPGFDSALDKICDELSEVGDLFIDISCEYTTEEEPEPYEDTETGEIIEPFWEDWMKLDRKDVLCILLGKELAACL